MEQTQKQPVFLFDVVEYERRCAENLVSILACNGDRPITEEDKEKVGLMVYRQMKSEWIATRASHGQHTHV